MENTLQRFAQEIFALSAPGSNGVSMYGGGIQTTGSDVALQLKKTMMLFIEQCKNRSSQAELQKTAAAIEGILRTEQVLNKLTEERCDSLVDRLRILTDAKS